MQCKAIGSKCSNRKGYNNRDTARIQGGYSQDTGRIQSEDSQDTGRIRSGYSGVVVVMVSVTTRYCSIVVFALSDMFELV